MLYNTLNPLWLHGFLVVPDGRILIERLRFGSADPAPWSASVGRLSYRLQESKKMLHSIILRRFGISLNENNADIEQLLTHSSPKKKTMHLSHMWVTMEIFRIRLLETITITTKRSSDIMAISFEELIDDVAHSRYEDASIEAINIVDAMKINF